MCLCVVGCRYSTGLRALPHYVKLVLSLNAVMVLCILLSALISIPLSMGLSLGENEDFQTVCSGRDFRLPVYSASRIVTFTPNSPPGPRRVLLDKNDVKDPRFEWTKDRTLLLREVTHGDQGLYSIKLASGFTYETVRLIVSECIKSFRRGYGETFQHSLPKDGFVLEFSPRGAPPEARPAVLWNRTDPQGGAGGRGQVQQGGRAWVAERVTQADQGNYTVRDSQGKALSRGTLTVQAHTFNVTRFPKESLHIPLFLPLSHAHLVFIPAPRSDDPRLATFDLGPPRGPMQLVRDGRVVEQDPRYRSLVSLARNGSASEVVVSRLSSRHDGLYEVRDPDGNLVSSTSLHVVEKRARWRSVLKSITVPSGMFVSLAGFILFMKRYPNCSLSQIISGLRSGHAPPAPAAASPPRINMQDYSLATPKHSGVYNHPQQLRATSRGSPSPSHSGYSYAPVMDSGHRLSPGHFSTGGQVSLGHFGTGGQVSLGHLGTGGQVSPGRLSREARVADRERDVAAASHTLSTEDPDVAERRTSFSVPGSSDCLHSSEDCVQFQIKSKRGEEGRRPERDFFSSLPLDSDTSDACSVYTSHKFNLS